MNTYWVMIIWMHKQSNVIKGKYLSTWHAGHTEVTAIMSSKKPLMSSKAPHRSLESNITIIVSSALMAAITTIAMVTRRYGGALRTVPLRWPLPGKGQAQAGVRASGTRRLVWRSEPSIHRLTQQPGITVTLWVWHPTFALTSWPPVTAAADRCE